MSYILDALRRAEADRERERGQVPGLHTQAPAGDAAARAAGPRRWLPWAGGGLLLLLGIGAGSWWASGPPDSVVPAPAPAPVAVPAPAPPPIASAPVPQPAASTSAYLAPAPPPAAVTAPAPGGAAAPPAPAAEAHIPRLAELPENLRRELPRLAISGSVYSEDPASRFVMVNGEVVREGAQLGADLVLERIGPRELVLRFRGQRFRQSI